MVRRNFTIHVQFEKPGVDVEQTVAKLQRLLFDNTNCEVAIVEVGIARVVIDDEAYVAVRGK